ncbi:dipicolinic acid synthetase subunit A [Bacillus sp. Marseille-P3661]|uniref:dipicolinic acid synthetase subunit A n=1 Tax=Bacillus sp. Marseille-P3661 TaxID=1936234 RepID=UPI000C83FB40|nr:dipicolinic acid synthetase subunit A [Bacillus sp. Marseille-P3661]
MLTGLHIAVIGGDARQLEVIRKLTELDAKLSLVGFDQLDHTFSGASKKEIDEVDFSECDAVILPIPGTGLAGEIETIFSNEKIVLTEEMLRDTPEHCMVFSGVSNQYLDTIISNTNRQLIKLFERDDVAIFNSIPTVEGTIMMVIQNTDVTIHGSDIVILGLGRTGMSLARTFSCLGANVKVGARKSKDIARITEMGLKAFYLSDLANEVSDTDIVINTVPVLILTAGVISKMPVHTLIIDLASKPGGTDFRYAEKRGIKALLAPGLPGIVAPKTAGQIVANVISQLLNEQLQQGKGKKQ